MDNYTLLCENYLYIEGKVNTPANVVGDVCFLNNGLAFLFSKMRYEINEIELQKIKSPGISSCLKGYCSYIPNDLHTLENAAWGPMTDDNNKNFFTNNLYTGCIQKIFSDFLKITKKYYLIVINNWLSIARLPILTLFMLWVITLSKIKKLQLNLPRYYGKCLS